MLYLYGYDKDLVYQGAESFTAPGSRNITVWYKDIVETMIAGNTNFLLNGANVRYVRIGLYCNAELYAGAANVRFSDIVLSTIRKAAPTAGVVNKDTAATGTATVIPTSWGVITAAWTPTADTDVYFVQLNVMSLTGTAEFRLKVGTSYYPDVNGWALENGTWLFTVPKNVNGVACQFEGQNTGGTKTYTYRRIAWGHSPHTHV
jgi:hypothetical protein